jgi:hypothetical protein
MTRILSKIAECRQEFGDRQIIIEGVLVVLLIGGWVAIGVVAR